MFSYWRKFNNSVQPITIFRALVISILSLQFEWCICQQRLTHQKHKGNYDVSAITCSPREPWVCSSSSLLTINIKWSSTTCLGIRQGLEIHSLRQGCWLRFSFLDFWLACSGINDLPDLSCFTYLNSWLTKAWLISFVS